MFAAAAGAQSSVTLYGLLNLGYGQKNGGQYEMGTVGKDHSRNGARFQQIGNERMASRWGLKGSEDLGAGLQARFNLEQGFNPESGADNRGNEAGFDRAAWVGLAAADFGQVRVGRQRSVTNAILGRYSLSAKPITTSSYGNARLSASASPRLGSRRDSELVYLTPKFHGFSAALGYLNKYDLKDSLGGTARTSEAWAAGANYVVGALSLGAAYESKVVGRLANLDGGAAAWGLGAKYDFGTFVVGGNYFDNHFRADGKGYGLGVAVPIGAFTVGMQVAYNYRAYATDANGYVTDGNGRREKLKPVAGELFAQYAFSKRTSVYCNYGRLDGDAQAFQNADSKNSWGMGLIHRF